MKITIASKQNIDNIYDNIIEVENAMEKSNENGLVSFAKLMTISDEDHESHGEIALYLW